jgi:hypothetical protein
MKYPNLDLYRFKIRLKLSDELVTPEYKGSLLRGAFAWSFRNTVCVTKLNTCESCSLRGNCSYFKIFETELPVTHIPYLKGIKKVPHPFVLVPPLNEITKYKAGDILEIELKLFGSAVQLLPYYVFVFKNIGKHGIGRENTKFEVERFTNIDYCGNESEIISSETGDINLNYKPITVDEMLQNIHSEAKEIKLNFLSPLRLQANGKEILKKDGITPKILTVNIVKRYLALAGLYGKESFVEEQPLFDFDLISIAENNLKFYDWGRYSNRQKTYLDLGGFTGSLTLSGEVSAILPYLYIGSFINMGKNSAFGLGKFEVTESQSHEVTKS